MINVAVCDDETNVVEQIKNYLVNYQSDKNFQLNVNVFSNGEELLESKIVFDLIFLDIEMNGIDGIRAAKILRQRFRKTKIVYISSHSELALASYAVHPFDFIEKPLSKDKITNVLNEFMTYLSDLPNEYTIVEFKGVNGPILLEPRNIFVLEYTGNRRVTIYTSDKKYEVRGSLYNVIKLIPSDSFTSPHKSFIINMEYVKSQDNFMLFMTNNIEVPIAQKKLKEFQKEFSRFIKNYIKQE